MVAAYSDRLVWHQRFGPTDTESVVLAKQIATSTISRGRCFPQWGWARMTRRNTKPVACQNPTGASVPMRRSCSCDSCNGRGSRHARRRVFTCHDVSITPKPFLQPSPPVWIGGRTVAAAKRVGQVGDGWLVSSVTPDECAMAVTSSLPQRRNTSAQSRTITLASCCPTTSHRRSKAVAKAASFVTRQRPDAFTAFSAVGTTEHIAEMIQQYVDAGARNLSYAPCVQASPWHNWR